MNISTAVRISIVLLILLTQNAVVAQNWEERPVQYSSTLSSTNGSYIVLDYDNDGRDDILYGNRSRRELFLLRNNDTSILQLEIIADSLYGVGYLHAVDYNNDGLDDFIADVSTQIGYGIWKAIQQPDHSYEWTFLDYAPDLLQNLVAEDFDSDGDMDIIYDDYENSNVIWRMTNDGSENFTTDFISYTGQPTVLYGKADLDADGDMDLLTSYYNFSLSEFVLVSLENTGNMQFTLHESIVLPAGGDGLVGRFTGNELPDLAYASQYETGEVVVYRNDGNFQFSLSTLDFNMSNYTSFGPPLDLLNDGYDEIVMYDNGAMKMAFQSDAGIFSVQNMFSNALGPAIGYSDFNSDLWLDVATSGIEIWHKNQTVGYTQVFENVNGGSSVLAVANTDQNENPDIFTGSYGLRVSSFIQRFDEKMYYPVHHTIPGPEIDPLQSTKAILPFDRDDDGDTDLLCQGSNRLFWKVNDGNGSFTHLNVDDDLNGTKLWVGYLDSDSFHDILFYDDASLRRWEWNGNSYNNTTLSSDAYPYFEVLDVENDGDNDVLYFGYTFPDYYLQYLKNVNGNFTVQTLYNLNDYMSNAQQTFDIQFPMLTTDLDSDGDQDVLFSNDNADYIAWMRNDVSTFHIDVFNIPMTDPQGFDVGDVDNDGDQDIVYFDDGLDDIVLLYNDGNEVFTSAAIDNYVSFPTGFKFADMEHDGDLDIVFSSGTDRRIGWLENDTFDCQRSYSNSSDVICAGDSLMFDNSYISEAGFYTDTLVAQNGCDSIAAFILDIHPQLTIDISNQNNILQLTGTGMIDIEWYHNDVLIPNEVNASINVADYGVGNYYAVITSELGCAQSTMTIQVNTIIGVEENNGPLITVYPNPANNNLIIHAADLNITTVIIFDVSGKICYRRENIFQNKITINTSNYDNGIYLMECEDTNGHVSRKPIQVMH